MSKLSVVMPIYIGGSFKINLFKSTISAFNKQSVENFELIFVIDGFSNKSLLNNVLDICGNLNGSKIFLFDKNHGPVYAINFGITRASGKYLTIHDADDLSDSSRFEKLMFYLNQSGDSFVSSYIYVRKPTGEIRVKGFDQDNVINKFKNRGLIKSPANLGASIISLSTMIDMGGIEYKFAPDSLFCIKLNLIRYICYGKKFNLIKEPLFTWVRNSGSITMKNRKKYDDEVNKDREEIALIKDKILNAKNEHELKNILDIKDNFGKVSKINYTVIK